MTLKRRRKWTFPGLLCILLLIPFLLVLIQLVLWKSSISQPQATYLDVSDQDIKQLLVNAEVENKERIARIKRVCGGYNLGLYKKKGESAGNLQTSIKHPPTPQYGVFYIDLTDSLAYCPIYKAASTTWLFNLCLLSEMSEEELNEKNKIQQLSTTARELYPEMDYEEAEKAVKKSFKLLVVRHPFERLLSAYRDKLENTNLGFEHGTKHFYKKYGAKIVKKYRAAGASTDSRSVLRPGTYIWPRDDQPQPSGKEPTFKEFVRYLIDIDLLNYADDHWIPYYLFCTPCLVEYDFVAKVETLWRDQSYVINSTRLRGKIRPGWRHSTKHGHGNESIAAVYFSQLTRSDVERLYQKYRLDFELFDYDVKPYLAYAG